MWAWAVADRSTCLVVDLISVFTSPQIAKARIGLYSEERASQVTAEVQRSAPTGPLASRRRSVAGPVDAGRLDHPTAGDALAVVASHRLARQGLVATSLEVGRLDPRVTGAGRRARMPRRRRRE